MGASCIGHPTHTNVWPWPAPWPTPASSHQWSSDRALQLSAAPVPSQTGHGGGPSIHNDHRAPARRAGA